MQIEWEPKTYEKPQLSQINLATLRIIYKMSLLLKKHKKLSSSNGTNVDIAFITSCFC